jgi:hypothetical protein
LKAELWNGNRAYKVEVKDVNKIVLGAYKTGAIQELPYSNQNL